MGTHLHRVVGRGAQFGAQFLLMLSRFICWLWAFLPDRCSIPDRHTYITCCRKGVRGNENLISVNNEAWIMCDYCTFAWRDKFRDDASVAKLVDARDLGSRVERRGGSSPFRGTNLSALLISLGIICCLLSVANLASWIMEGWHINSFVTTLTLFTSPFLILMGMAANMKQDSA